MRRQRYGSTAVMFAPLTMETKLPRICDTCGDFRRRCSCRFQNWSLCKQCQAKITWVYDTAKHCKTPIDGHIERDNHTQSCEFLRPEHTRHRCQSAPSRVSRPWVPQTKPAAPASTVQQGAAPAPTFSIEVWTDYGHQDQELIQTINCGSPAEVYAWLKSGGYCYYSPAIWSDGIDWAVLPWARQVHA